MHLILKHCKPIENPLSIHYPYRLRVTEEAGANPSWLRVRGWVHPELANLIVAKSSQPTSSACILAVRDKPQLDSRFKPETFLL